MSTLLLVYALPWLYHCPDATVQASTTSPPSTASAPAAFLWSDTDLDSQGPVTTSGQSPFLTALPATAGAIMLTWAGIALVLVGLGLGLAWWLGVRRVTSDTLLQAFWLGFCLALLGLQLAHLLVPIRWYCTLGLVVLSLSGWMRLGPAVRAWLMQTWSLSTAIWLLGALLVCAWVADQAIGYTVPTWDSGMYHIPAVVWAQHYPAVPGLGNLHGRLAFNNASLLVAAALAVGPWVDRAHHLLNGLLFGGVLGCLVCSLRRLVHSQQSGMATEIFGLVLLVPCIFLVSHGAYFTSLSTDYATTLTLFAAALILCRMGTATSDGPAQHLTAVTVAALLTTAICIKLSALVFVVVLAVRLWKTQAGLRLHGRAALVTWAIVGLLLGGWGAHGALLSGYVAYPNAFTALPVDWRVPRVQAEAEQAWISYYAGGIAGSPRPLKDAWRWSTRRWFRTLIRAKDEQRFVLLPVLLTLGCGALLLRRASHPTPLPPGLSAFPLACAAGMVFWLIVAPTARFGFFLFWLLAAWVSALACARHGLPTHAGTRVALLLGAVALLVLPWVHKPDPSMPHVLVRPVQDSGFYPLPAPELERRRTQHGLTVYVPTKDERCWAAPLPCTPHPSTFLHLRREDNMRWGFTVDGVWEPVRWPAPWSNFLDLYLAGRPRARDNIVRPAGS